MNSNTFQKSMPVLSALRPISYTDLPGFAGSGTPLFRSSPRGSGGTTAQLLAAAAPDGNGAPTANGDNLQKKISSASIILIVVLVFLVLR